MYRDLLLALRGLRKSPALTATIVATLALAIGANTAIFSLIQTVFLDPLLYPDRLVRLWQSNQKANQPYFTTSSQDFFDWRRQAHSFSDLAAWNTLGIILTHRGEPDRVLAARVSASLFSMLGYRPIAGRGIEPADEDPDKGFIIVLTRSLWASRFGSDPGIIGQEVNYAGGS
jgi:hypothetical protein